MRLFDKIVDGINNIIKKVEKSSADYRLDTSAISNNSEVTRKQASSHSFSTPSAHKSKVYHGNGKMTRFVKVRRTYRTESGRAFVPLWQKAGWRLNAQNPNYSIGQYKFYSKKLKKTLRWDGAIKNSLYEVKVYIKDPPSFLKNHQHWQCFMHQGDGWYLVHFLERINGLDDAILNVQRLISEAYLFC